jgi:hypothetical protein
MGFDIGPTLAMSPGEMITTQQVDDLGRNRRLDNITSAVGSSQTHGLYIDDLAVSARTAAMQFSWQEK